jgi:spore coat-associated protein N
MTRFTKLWKANPRRLLAGLGALMVAAALAVGSGANFNSTSANPSNVFSAGTLAQTNSHNNAAILTASNLKPGDSASGTVDIKNTGSISGTFSLARTSLTDVPASPAFSSKLTLIVTDQGDPACVSSCPAAVVKYTGVLGSMGTIALGTFAANENHRYHFAVTFPDGGAGGADNAYAGASSTAGYTWTSAS